MDKGENDYDGARAGTKSQRLIWIFKKLAITFSLKEICENMTCV